MHTVNSISGGQTSAYISAKYPADFNVFALVRTDDPKCIYPDKRIRSLVEDKTQKPFVGTLEDDVIIKTILDLEQFIGKKIDWVTGVSFDEVVKSKGGWLPNKLHRYCTSHLKIEPLFNYWRANFIKPVEMRIGYRANEMSRAKKMNSKLTSNGFLEYKTIIGKRKSQNKWGYIEWQKPVFPLIKDSVFKDDIVSYWRKKPVLFAELNNCVGCFHRNPMLLRKQFEYHPTKMEWFAKQERNKKKGNWRSDLSYDKISKHKIQNELDFSDFSICDTGFCGI